jgi:hypothetical protein
LEQLSLLARINQFEKVRAEDPPHKKHRKRKKGMEELMTRVTRLGLKGVDSAETGPLLHVVVQLLTLIDPKNLKMPPTVSLNPENKFFKAYMRRVLGVLDLDYTPQQLSDADRVLDLIQDLLLKAEFQRDVKAGRITVEEEPPKKKDILPEDVNPFGAAPKIRVSRGRNSFITTSSDPFKTRSKIAHSPAPKGGVEEPVVKRDAKKKPFAVLKTNVEVQDDIILESKREEEKKRYEEEFAHEDPRSEMDVEEAVTQQTTFEDSRSILQEEEPVTYTGDDIADDDFELLSKDQIPDLPVDPMDTQEVDRLVRRVQTYILRFKSQFA